MLTNAAAHNLYESKSYLIDWDKVSMINMFVNMFLMQLDVSCHSSSVWGLSADKRFIHARKRIRGINSVLSIDFERNLCFTLILSNFDILLSFYAALKFWILCIFR